MDPMILAVAIMAITVLGFIFEPLPLVVILASDFVALCNKLQPYG